MKEFRKLSKPEQRVRIDKLKVKAHFKGWAASIRMNNTAQQIPDELLDTFRIDDLIKSKHTYN